MQRKLKMSKVHDNNPKNPVLTVVMIHGIASDAAFTYNDALKHFEADVDLKNVRFVSFDLLGSGTSYASDDLEYNFDEQLEALDNAISDLNSKTPLVLVAHSLGTFIATRYVALNPDKIDRLILISAPIYTEKDYENPAFMAGIEGFKKLVGAKDPQIIKEKSFINSMKNIVLDKTNYSYLSGVKIPTTLVFGDEDQLVAAFNIPGLMKENEGIAAVKTHGRHGVTKDKYEEVAEILKQIIAETK